MSEQNHRGSRSCWPSLFTVAIIRDIGILHTTYTRRPTTTDSMIMLMRMHGMPVCSVGIESLTVCTVNMQQQKYFGTIEPPLSKHIFLHHCRVKYSVGDEVERDHKTVPTATNMAYGMVSRDRQQQKQSGGEEGVYEMVNRSQPSSSPATATTDDPAYAVIADP